MNPRSGSLGTTLLLITAAGVVVYLVGSPSAKSQTADIQSRGQLTPLTESGHRSGATPSGTSAIQHELDALYARQGEKAPLMTPAAAASSAAAENSLQEPSLGGGGVPGGQSAPPRLQIPPTTLAEKPTSFWRKLIPWGHSNTPKSMPVRRPRRSATPHYGRLTYANTVKGESDITGRPLGDSRGRNDLSSSAGPAAPSMPGTSPTSVGSDAAQRSAIQQELQELYRRDGRPMPPMMSSAAPGQGGARNPASARTHATDSHKQSLVRKLLPFLPDDEPEQPSVTQSLPPAGTQPNSFGRIDDEETESRPRLFPGLRSLSQKKGTKPAGDEPTPPTDAETAPQIADVKSSQPIGPQASLENSDDDFADPFTDVSEAEADKMNKVNPFTGLTLDNQPTNTNPMPPAEDADSGNNKLATKSTESGSAPWPSESSGAAGSDRSEIDIYASPTDKMQQIAARAGQAGLKGFCPVALRDHRDLVDVNPKFTVFYKSKQVQLSSLEAQKKFEQNPELYVPAFDGHDAILASHYDNEVDGTLDYALWYRDRLYLFHGPETMAEFSKSPNRYAMPDNTSASRP